MLEWKIGDKGWRIGQLPLIWFIIYTLFFLNQTQFSMKTIEKRIAVSSDGYPWKITFSAKYVWMFHFPCNVKYLGENHSINLKNIWKMCTCRFLSHKHKIWLQSYIIKWHLKGQELGGQWKDMWIKGKRLTRSIRTSHYGNMGFLKGRHLSLWIKILSRIFSTAFF